VRSVIAVRPEECFCLLISFILQSTSAPNPTQVPYF
jgi:hypothetical protein